MLPNKHKILYSLSYCNAASPETVNHLMEIRSRYRRDDYLRARSLLLLDDALNSNWAGSMCKNSAYENTHLKIDVIGSDITISRCVQNGVSQGEERQVFNYPGWNDGGCGISVPSIREGNVIVAHDLEPPASHRTTGAWAGREQRNIRCNAVGVLRDTQASVDGTLLGMNDSPKSIVFSACGGSKLASKIMGGDGSRDQRKTDGSGHVTGRGGTLLHSEDPIQEGRRCIF